MSNACTENELADLAFKKLEANKGPNGRGVDETQHHSSKLSWRGLHR